MAFAVNLLVSFLFFNIITKRSEKTVINERVQVQDDNNCIEKR